MINPIAFEFLGIKIHWYGIVYFLGFLFAYFYFVFNFKDLEGDVKDTIFLWTSIFSIIGGRLFYVLFYNPIYYIHNLLEVFALWDGGMSIHGGIFFGALSLYYFSKKYKINYLILTDFFVIPLSFFLALGRIANFINQELYGYPIKNPHFKFFGVVFPKVDSKLRYPTQLFSSLKNYILFYFLTYYKELKNINLKVGELSAYFLIFYNFGRFFIDFLRVPTGTGFLLRDLTGISLGQLFCLIYGTFGLFLLYLVYKNKVYFKDLKLRF